MCSVLGQPSHHPEASQYSSSPEQPRSQAIDTEQPMACFKQDSQIGTAKPLMQSSLVLAESKSKPNATKPLACTCPLQHIFQAHYYPLNKMSFTTNGSTSHEERQQEHRQQGILGAEARKTQSHSKHTSCTWETKNNALKGACLQDFDRERIEKKLPAPEGVPRQSPTLVLTRPCAT
jgi:hypothetical protein